MRSWLLVAALLAVPAHSALPARSTGGGTQLDRCLAAPTPPNQSGMAHVMGCYRSADIRLQTALDTTYRAQETKLKAGGKSTATLAAGEAAWKAYRDKWCAFESAAERDPGSVHATELQCRVEVSQAHLARLKGAY